MNNINIILHNIIVIMINTNISKEIINSNNIIMVTNY